MDPGAVHTMLVGKGLRLRQPVLAPGCSCCELRSRNQGQNLHKVLSDLASAGKAPPEGLVHSQAPLVPREMGEVEIPVQCCNHL